MTLNRSLDRIPTEFVTGYIIVGMSTNVDEDYVIINF